MLLRQRPPGRGAFSLIELLVAIGVIVILLLLLIPVWSGMQARAQRSQCMANLKSLAVGANLYIQQNGSWPQMNATIAGGTEEEIAAWWIKTLEPYSVPRKTWICPTIQNLLGNPDYTQPDNVRIDYFTTAFDDKPTSPHEWPRQPWFIERGDVHGNGPLIIFTDGSISDLNTFKSTSSGQ